MKKLAVEWLMEKLQITGEVVGNDNEGYIILMPNVKIKDIEQAKEMEKQQIIYACNQTDFFGDDSRLPGLEYYNKTFKIK